MFKMNYIYGEQILDKGIWVNEFVNMELEGGGGLIVTNIDCMVINQCNKYIQFIDSVLCFWMKFMMQCVIFNFFL